MSENLVEKKRAVELPAGPLGHVTPAFTLQDQLKGQRCALLIIDMQNDFTSESGLLAQRGRDPALARGIIDKVNQLVDIARQAGQLVVWVATSHSFQEALPNYLAVHLRDLPENKWTPEQLLVSEGAEGAEWHKDITARLPAEPLVTKNMYSAFRGTRLKQILDANGIRSLVLAGCNTNVCIHSTATDAFFDGYYPILCEDACATSSVEIHDAIISTHRIFYGLTATVKQIEGQWGRG
jgi:nicotinamidase-related amidase